MNEQLLDLRERKRLSKRRGRVREYLRENSVFPPYGEPLTPEQQIIDDQISNNDFSYQENYVKDKLRNLGYHISNEVKMINQQDETIRNKFLTSEDYKLKNKRTKIRAYLRKHGIFPPYGEPLTPEQEIIHSEIENNDFSSYEEILRNKPAYFTSIKPEVSLEKKRQRARAYLRGYGILPPIKTPLTPEQQIIETQISNNDFTVYKEMVERNKLSIKNNIPVTHNGSKVNQADISINAPKHVYHRLRICQILPPVGEVMTEDHENIVKDIKENWKGKTKSFFIVKYLHLSTPEGRILYRTYKKHRDNGFNFNITIDDIIIPEYCPYLEIKLLTDPKDHKSPNYATIDRIDSSKGYVKGNVQVISYKANSMKSSSTEKQLLEFAVNGLKLIENM